MPEHSQRRQSRRQEISQRDTYRASPGLSPKAQPVDAYAPGRGGQSTGNLEALQKALKSSESFIQSYSQAKTKQNRMDQREGAAAAKRGEEEPEDKSQPYLHGYYKVKGQGAAAEFENEVRQYHNENWDQDPETFRKGLEEIEQKYIEGQPESYLEGFVPQAQKVEQKVFGQYQETQHEQQKRKFLDNVNKAFNQRILEIQENDNLSSKERAKKTRQLLSQYQKEGKKLGLTRDEVTSRLLASIGSEAEKQADPDMLDFIREPSQGSGIRVIDTKLQSQARKWEKAAMEAAQREEENEEARREELKAQAKEQLHRDFVTRLSEVDPNNTQALREMKQQLRTIWNNPENNKYNIALDPEDMESVIGSIDDMLELGDFSEQTDVDVQTAYRRQITEVNSKEDADSILKQLRASKAAFTKSDYQTLVTDIIQERNSLSNQDVQRAKNRFTEFKTKRLKTLKEADTGIFSLDDGTRAQQDSRRVAYASEELSSRVSSYREEQGGDYPSLKELREIWKEVKEDAYEQYPDTKLTGEGNNQTSSNSNDNHSQKSSEEDKKQKVLDRLQNMNQ